MKILYIGGTGNISTHCAALMHRQGHEIWVVTRGRSLVPREYKAVVADRHNVTELRHAARQARPDVVINFLGYTPADIETDREAFGDGLAQYIFISSASVYAKPPPVLPITEAAPRGNPFWDYAAKKIECERLLEGWFATGRFPMTIVRPSHTYSERWVPNAISSSSYTFAARIEQGRPVFVHDQGLTLWTLTHSRDFAAGLAGLVGNQKALGEAFHITSDEALAWNEIYAEIAQALGVVEPEIIPIPTEFICETVPRFRGTLLGDKAHPGVFDNAKLKSAVPGFECVTPFSRGVAESIDWLRQHPEAHNRSAEIEAEIDLVLHRWRERKERLA